MVCIYCGSETRVVNSRKQRRSNNIWRRRVCTKCSAVFTTHEETDLSAVLVVQSKDRRHNQKFLRDKLFLSVYESCKHRPSALIDAAELTDTIINALAKENSGAIIPQEKIVHATEKILKRFDATAAVFYHAYHAGSDSPTS